MAAIPTDLQPAGDDAAERGRTLRETLAMLARRRLLVLGVFALLLAIAAIVALVMPPVYRSTATILIKEQEIPQELVRSTVTSFADERIQVISQQVMTRKTLLEMVEKYDLYASERKRETSEEILDRMRRDIKLTPISAEVTDRRTGSPIKSTIAFSLAYDSDTAGNALKVANELTTLFLNENVKNRQQKAAETTSFLDEELTRVSAHVSDLEQQLADYKLRNQGRTPDLGQTNQAGSERMFSELQRLDRDFAFMQERKASLQRQLAETKPNLPVIGAAGAIAEPQDRLVALQTQLAGLVGIYSEAHPDIRRLRREIANLKIETGGVDDLADREHKLLELQSQLSQLRQRYADDHPDVVRLKRIVAVLETAIKADGGAAERAARLKDLQAQIAALKAKYPAEHPEVLRLQRTYALLEGAVKAGGGGASAPRLDRREPRKPDNPVYTTLQEQLDTANAQLQSLQAERTDTRAKLGQLDARLSATPEAEREYLELARDLDSSRARFRELREKQMQAQVAEQLERDRKAERFTLIEPAIFPEKPYRPNRGLILLVGFFLAAGGGVSSAAVRESLDRTVHAPRDVTRVLQVPVLAVIPAVTSAGALRRRTLQRRLALAAGVGLALLALALFHFLYMPLDVAWYGVMRRIFN